MSVYFITAREVGRVKIGTAYDPFRRLAHLRTFSPCELVLEAIFVGARKIEREYHERFAPHRVRGEWFSLSPEIEELIASVKPPKPPRSIAQRRRLHEMHRDPERLGPHLPPKHILNAWHAEQELQRAVGTLPDNLRGLPRDVKRRIVSGDIHFPFRSMPNDADRSAA